MEKIFKNKWLWVLLGVFFILFLGGFLFINRENFKDDKTKNERSQTDQTDKNYVTEKTDNPVSEETKNSDEGKPTPEINTPLAELNNVTLTVYLMQETTTSIDGKTNIPAQSIQPYFYPQGAGVYSIQKQSGSLWIDVVSNVSYPGHGGIAGSFTSSSEDNISYRVVKIENGKSVAVSKTFVIKRSDLTDGFETYN